MLLREGKVLEVGGQVEHLEQWLAFHAVVVAGVRHQAGDLFCWRGEVTPNMLRTISCSFLMMVFASSKSLKPKQTLAQGKAARKNEREGH